MRVRLAIAAAATTVVTGGALAAAAPQPPPQTPLVTVGHENGGIQVRTAFPGQPLLGVSADNSGVCVGFSYQMPFCVPVAVS